MSADLIERLEAKKQAFNAACQAWSRDDGKDFVKTIQRGEDVMFAGIEMSQASYDVIESLRARQVNEAGQ